MKRIIIFLGKFFSRLKHITEISMIEYEKTLLNKIGEDVFLSKSNIPFCLRKVTFEDSTVLQKGANFIISAHGEDGRLVVKEKSAIGINFTVITGNHQRKKGQFIRDSMAKMVGDENKDVIINQDVWIGANVSILAGVTVGRGSNIGTGAVIRNDIPPYAIVIGNPAKVIGFCLTPEEIIEHEKALYPEAERLPLELLEKNYEKYFLKRLKEIKEFTRL